MGWGGAVFVVVSVCVFFIQALDMKEKNKLAQMGH